MSEGNKAREHLANERTFLAWVRTGVAVMSLGFVVAKFGLWLQQMPGAVPPSSKPAADWSTPLGSAMIAVGVGLCLLAAWHHRRTGLAIERDEVGPAAGLVRFVAGLMALLAAVMIVYLVLGARR